MINPKDIDTKKGQEELPKEFLEEFSNGKGDDENHGSNTKVQ